MSKKKSKNQPKPNYKKQQRQQAQQAHQADQAHRGNGDSGNARRDQGKTPQPAPSSAAALRPLSTPGPTPSRVVMLEPLAPIIVRSGRPFDFQAGTDAARFPPPSTLAGCLRTAWARETQTAFGPGLAEHAAAGPLLVRLDGDGRPQPLVPKPADAHYFGYAKEARCVRAEPGAFADDCGADLPPGLEPVRLAEEVDGKASLGPRWWSWADLIAWRDDPKQAPEHAQLTKNGWSPPAGDRRTHVAIDGDTLAADAGRLFQTEGLVLEADNAWLDKPDTPDLRLLARFSEPLAAGLVHLGGERRLARLHPAPQSDWPRPPEGWFSRIRSHGGLTLTLLTPAIFARGYRPDWLDDTLQGEPPGAPGLRLQLVAAALERWQPHSGWDLVEKAPRATRKLVAAGATYWFRLIDAPDDEALASLWLASFCDAEQDRRDGYGLALPAPWTPTV